MKQSALDPRIPSSDELLSVLSAVLERSAVARGPVRLVARESYMYTSTSPVEVVTCDVGDGAVRPVLCKYPGTPEHRLHGSRRGTAGEAVMYREVLPVLGVTRPEFFGAHVDPASGETWLFLEFLPDAVRVQRAPDPGSMTDAANWLGSFHARAERKVREGFVPPIPHPDRDFYLGWARRTRAFTEPVRDRYPWLESACAHFPDAVDALVSAPATIVHSEFHLPNVLWDHGHIVPVDWESARIGPGELDLVALCAGWEPEDVARYEAAYATARWPDGVPEGFARRIRAAAYYWAFRPIGGRADWTLARGSAPLFDALRRIAAEWAEAESAGRT